MRKKILFVFLPFYLLLIMAGCANMGHDEYKKKVARMSNEQLLHHYESINYKINLPKQSRICLTDNSKNVTETKKKEIVRQELIKRNIYPDKTY